jgi:hypothetical protein
MNDYAKRVIHMLAIAGAFLTLFGLDFYQVFHSTHLTDEIRNPPRPVESGPAIFAMKGRP